MNLLFRVELKCSKNERECVRGPQGNDNKDNYNNYLKEKREVLTKIKTTVENELKNRGISDDSCEWRDVFLGIECTVKKRKDKRRVKKILNELEKLILENLENFFSEKDKANELDLPKEYIDSENNEKLIAKYCKDQISIHCNFSEKKSVSGDDNKKTFSGDDIRYYSVLKHMVSTYIKMALFAILSIVFGVLAIKGLFAIIEKIDWLKISRGEVGYLSDYIGGFLGFLVAFIGEQKYIARLHQIENYKKLMDIVCESIFTMETELANLDKCKKLSTEIIDEILKSPESVYVLIKMPKVPIKILSTLNCIKEEYNKIKGCVSYADLVLASFRLREKMFKLRSYHIKEHYKYGLFD